MRISVCMATYNGMPFVIDQVRSILDEIGDNSELIIVDDCSNDGTADAVLLLGDNRIRLLRNNINIGVVPSFSKAMEAAKGEYIFLSDQDDIWKAGRCSLMIEKMNVGKYNLVTSNFEWIDENNEKIYLKYDGVLEEQSSKHFKNIFDIFLGKTNYFGCAMLVRRRLFNIALPIPSFVESHDLWIAIVGNLSCSNYHMNGQTFLKRKHSNNASSLISNRPLHRKLYSRLLFITSIICIKYRMFKSKN